MANKPEPDAGLPEHGSAAQHYQPDALRQSALDNVEAGKGEFNRAVQGQSPEPVNQNSEQVGKTAAEPRIKPPADLDRAGAAGAHKEQMVKDDLASKLSPRQQAVYEAAKQRQEAERGGISQERPGMDR